MLPVSKELAISRRETRSCVVEDLKLLHILLIYDQRIDEQTSSDFSINSEAFAAELIENGALKT